MYQFSRSMYRELAGDVMPDRCGDVSGERQRFLRACEASMKPVKTLFHDVRGFFPITQQMRVYRVVQRHVELAKEYVDEQAREGVTFDGSPLCCHASTRKGTACQRVPLPGSKYCPSHKHLEEEFEVAAA
jgi:hypothetical protein